jgi:hypothetical protein
MLRSPLLKPFWEQPFWRWDAMFDGGVRASEYFDMSNSESPQCTGRIIAALASDPDVMSRTGRVWVGAALAQEYGIDDIDGKQPKPMTFEQA